MWVRLPLVRTLVAARPTYGYRRVTAILNRQLRSVALADAMLGSTIGGSSSTNSYRRLPTRATLRGEVPGSAIAVARQYCTKAGRIPHWHETRRGRINSEASRTAPYNHAAFGCHCSQREQTNPLQLRRSSIPPTL